MKKYKVNVETTNAGYSGYVEGIEEGFVCSTGATFDELIDNIMEAVKLHTGEEEGTFVVVFILKEE